MQFVGNRVKKQYRPGTSFAVLLISVFIFVRSIFVLSGRISRISKNLDGYSGFVAPGVSQHSVFNLPLLQRSADTLIIVACHAVIAGESLDAASVKDDVWLLLDYQQKQDFPAAFVEHIKAGINLAASIPSSLLVFSGGQTRLSAGPKSEASSYYAVAEHYNFFGRSKTVRQRTALEEYARDSLENLLFSICRFKEVTGRYPVSIQLISFSYKKERFVRLHRQALRFPESNFIFQGIDPKDSKLRGAKFDLKRFSVYEKTQSLVPFENDPYGCHSDILRRKRSERNPFLRTVPYEYVCPEIRDLLRWCGPGIFEGILPWTS